MFGAHNEEIRAVGCEKPARRGATLSAELQRYLPAPPDAHARRQARRLPLDPSSSFLPDRRYSPQELRADEPRLLMLAAQLDPLGNARAVLRALISLELKHGTQRRPKVRGKHTGRVHDDLPRAAMEVLGALCDPPVSEGSARRGVRLLEDHRLILVRSRSFKASHGAHWQIANGFCVIPQLPEFFEWVGTLMPPVWQARFRDPGDDDRHAFTAQLERSGLDADQIDRLDPKAKIDRVARVFGREMRPSFPLVLQCLAQATQGGRKRVRPSHATIAAETSLSVSSIRRTLADMRAAGLLASTATFRPAVDPETGELIGWRWTDSLRLTLPTAAELDRLEAAAMQGREAFRRAVADRKQARKGRAIASRAARLRLSTARGNKMVLERWHALGESNPCLQNENLAPVPGIEGREAQYVTVTRAQGVERMGRIADRAIPRGDPIRAGRDPISSLRDDTAVPLIHFKNQKKGFEGFGGETEWPPDKPPDRRLTGRDETKNHTKLHLEELQRRRREPVMDLFGNRHDLAALCARLLTRNAREEDAGRWGGDDSAAGESPPAALPGGNDHA